MKKYILLFISLVYLMSCTDKIEKQANEYYVLAEQAYAKGAYEVAREKIDSIRLLFPKAFKTRRAALDLRLKVDLAEGQQAVEDADKIILINDGEIIAVGNHQELLKDCSIYAEIFRLQQKGGSENA